MKYMRVALKIEQAFSAEGRELKQSAMIARDPAQSADYFMQDLACKAKTVDQLFEETGIERDQIDRAVKFYF